MLIKASLAKKLKQALVFLKMDISVANLYARFPFKVLYRAIPSWEYYGPTEVKRVRRYGVRFEVYPADFSQWTIFSSQIDSHVFVARKLIGHRQDGVILDVGANCGIFGLVIAKHFSDKQIMKTVFCYEPNPKVFKFLCSNLQQNPVLLKNVKLFRKGLGNHNGFLEMQIPLRNSGAGSILRNYESEPHDAVKFEISSIDIELMNIEKPVDFIKIDVENYEYFVLDGARNIIQKDRPVIYFEVGPGQLHQLEMFQLLDSFGYKFFVMINQKFVEFIPSPDTYPWFSNLDNVIAVHKRSTPSLS